MTDKRPPTEKLSDDRLARETLTRYVAPGTQIHCFTRSVAKSGMSRSMDFYVVDPRTLDITRITWHIARLCDYRLNRHGHLVRKGFNLDMVSDTVNCLAKELFGNLRRPSDPSAWMLISRPH